MPHLPKTPSRSKQSTDIGTIRLEILRGMVQKLVPRAVETISYGIPTFDVDGAHLVHMAAYKRHVGFYPSPAAIAHFAPRLTSYIHAKGSVQFPHDRPFPKTLIQSMIRFRLKMLLKTRG